MSCSHTLDAPDRVMHTAPVQQDTLEKLLDAAAKGGTGADLGAMSREERRRYMFTR